jgi:CDP-diacylglycerol--serine O-phosphatidyltransferase
MATDQFTLGPLGVAILLRALPGGLAIGLSLHQQQLSAGICLVLAVWADVAVGFLAGQMGWQKAVSQVQLESQVDFLCFVVAPIIFCITLVSSPVVMLSSLLFLLCGAYRIARFNVEGLNKKGGYTGLPVTYNGYWFPLIALLEHVYPLTPDLVWCGVLILLSCLMVTRRVSIPEL